MIFVDASAMVAVLCREEPMQRIASAIDGAERIITSPIAVHEAGLALVHRKGISPRKAAYEVDVMVLEAEMEVVAITDAIGHMAMSAFERFGKGRHKAQLNMGDCFAYAVAKAFNMKILFVGDDFIHTDLESAIPAR